LFTVVVDMHKHCNDKYRSRQDECYSVRKQLFSDSEHRPCKTKTANDSVQTGDHEGHTANTFALRHRCKPPAECMVNCRHLMFELIYIKLLDHIHSEETLFICLTQANKSNKKADTDKSTNEQQCSD